MSYSGAISSMVGGVSEWCNHEDVDVWLFQVFPGGQCRVCSSCVDPTWGVDPSPSCLSGLADTWIQYGDSNMKLDMKRAMKHTFINAFSPEIRSFK